MFSKWVMWVWIFAAVVNWIAFIVAMACGVHNGMTISNLIQAIVWTGGVIWGIKTKEFSN